MDKLTRPVPEFLRVREYPAIRLFLENVAVEIARARVKFPSSDMCFAALVEEVGELAQALLERERATDIVERTQRWTHAHIYAEAIQVAAMACRIAVEGDNRFPSSRSESDK